MERIHIDIFDVSTTQKYDANVDVGAPIREEASRLPEILFQEEMEACKKLTKHGQNDWVTTFRNNSGIVTIWNPESAKTQMLEEFGIQTVFGVQNPDAWLSEIQTGLPRPF